jgi:hypothetical protein
MPGVERNPRASHNQGIKSGDFVDVRLNADPNSGFYGFVVLAGKEFLRIRVHEPVGNFESDRMPCLNAFMFIPMTSIAWIRGSVPGRPEAGCPCREGV